MLNSVTTLLDSNEEEKEEKNIFLSEKKKKATHIQINSNVFSTLFQSQCLRHNSNHVVTLEKELEITSLNGKNEKVEHYKTNNIRMTQEKKRKS